MLCSVSFLMIGCSAVTEIFKDPTEAPAQARLVMETTATGYQLFQCTRDNQGYYWRFITPQATLKDAKGRIVATQGADFAFKADDGSTLRSKIIAVESTGTHSRLKNALFQVSAHGQVTGSLSRYHWVRRTDARGGIPTIACTQQRRSQTIQVPFTAKYSFYD